MSEQGLDGFVFSPQRYTSAYEATVNHDTNVLASVCTTVFGRGLEEIKIKASDNYTVGTGYSLGFQKTATRLGFTSNALKYRGGTNDSSYDNETDSSSQNYSRNQLGLPISYVTREQCRSYTDINNNVLMYQYDTQKILYMLCQVEYKNRNIQEALGYGAVKYPSYEAYEAYWNKGVVDSGQNGISCIPCGVTNSLGNSSGEVYYRMVNVPIDAEGAKETAVLTEWGDVWMPCMSYRGVEHFWGHIYKIVDQLNVYMGSRVGYVEGHDGDTYYGIYPLTYYYEKNPYLTNNNGEENKKLGTWDIASNICCINSILMDDNGHIVPIGANDKTYTNNYCDCVEITNTNKILYASYNGRLVSNLLVGLNFIFAQKAADEVLKENARPSDGTRLDHF